MLLLLFRPFETVTPPDPPPAEDYGSHSSGGFPKARNYAPVKRPKPILIGMDDPFAAAKAEEDLLLLLI